MTLESDALDVALDAMSRHAAFTRRFRSELTTDDVISKGVEGPVTIVDVAGQALIRLHLEEDVLVPALPAQFL